VNQAHVHGAEKPLNSPLVLRGLGAAEENLDSHFQTGRFQGIRVKVHPVIHCNECWDTVGWPLALDVSEAGEPFTLG